MDVDSKIQMPEKKLYEPVRIQLGQLFRAAGLGVHLEISASKGAGEIIKRAIPRGREIIFSFLSKRPDILGYATETTIPRLIVVEVKARKLGLDDIYQLKKYKELMGASGAFLVSPEAIPEELKRLCDARPTVLLSADDFRAFIALAQFDLPSADFVAWFRDNPFEGLVRSWQG